MDIIPVFGTVVGGSNPSGSTSRNRYFDFADYWCILVPLRAWFSGRTLPCQGRGSGSIPGARTYSIEFQHISACRRFYVLYVFLGFCMSFMSDHVDFSKKGLK